MWMIVRPLHGLQLFVDVEFFAGFEQQYLHSVRRQNMRRHPAGCTGANDDGIVLPLQVDIVSVGTIGRKEVHKACTRTRDYASVLDLFASGAANCSRLNI